MVSEGSDHPKEEKQDQRKNQRDQHGAGTAKSVRKKEEHGNPVANLAAPHD
jgi:hypothetical protein